MTDSTNNFISNFKNLHERGLAFARAFVFDADLAEDITSEAMIVLWNKLRGGQNIEQPQIFLFAIIRNKSLECLRNQLSHLRLNKEFSDLKEKDFQLRISSAEVCDPHILFSTEVQTIIKQALSGMNPQTRSVFLLSRYDGMSNKDIAVQLGIASKTVEYHISKALKLLRQQLKDYLPLLLFFV